jgi:phosphoribosylformimino-5-aminoimidazole carboxamide ribotide isomerase
MRIIPAIDIINGKCVRLTQGNYNSQTIYHENPLEMAREFEAHGIEYLHLVDLDGARTAHIVNYRLLEQIATQTTLKIDFGGGIKSEEDVRIAFDSGANQITGGTIAVKDRETFLSWLNRYSSERVILGADAKSGKISVSGWEEETNLDLIPFIQNYLQCGIRYTICTDTALDGMLQGPALELYKDILKASKETGISLIASGGIRNIDDLVKLKEIGCEGAIIGKAIYEETLSLKELEEFIAAN